MQVKFDNYRIGAYYNPQRSFRGNFAAQKTDSVEFRGKEKRSARCFKDSSSRRMFGIMPAIVKDIKYASLSNECKEAAKNTIKAAKIVEKEFNSKYGKGNYSFVSIGTSPACIGRYFEFMGYDTKYVPLSGLRNINFPVDELTEYQDYGEYSRYLDTIGLTRSEIKKSGKKQIFCDYTCSGKTLDTVEYYAKCRRGLGENEADFVSLNSVLQDYAEENPKEKKFTDDYIKELSTSKFSKYSGIPHVYCMCVDKIGEVLKEKQNRESLNFNFALLYQLEKTGDLRR